MKKKREDYSQVMKLSKLDGERLKKIAYVKHMTIQNVLTTAMTDYIHQNLDLVKKHDEFFNSFK